MSDGEPEDRVTASPKIDIVVSACCQVACARWQWVWSKQWLDCYGIYYLDTNCNFVVLRTANNWFFGGGCSYHRTGRIGRWVSKLLDDWQSCSSYPTDYVSNCLVGISGPTPLMSVKSEDKQC